MLFSQLADYLEQLEKTSSRLEITRILAQLFKKATEKEIDKICYLCLGQLAPKYVDLDFQLAEKMMVRAVAQAVEKDPAAVLRLYKKRGDLGEVLLEVKSQNSKVKSASQKSKLSVNNVYEKLVEIAKEAGAGSQERKLQGMGELLRELDPLSAKYVARIPVKKLRLGFSDLTMIDALSWSQTGDKTLRPEIEAAFNVVADIGRIAKIFLAKGRQGMKALKPEVGVPIRAAKAVALNDPKEILAKMNGKAALEAKLDGFRTQIHIDRSRKFSLVKDQSLGLFEDNKHFVRIFSRNLDNITYMFPDVVSAAQKLPVKQAILDGEAIAVDSKTGKFLPFQETVQRKRKHGIAAKAKEVPLKVFLFDALLIDGKSLLALPFMQRREMLKKLMAGHSDGLVVTEQIVVTKPETFDAYFKKMVSGGLEGLMAKKLDAPYQAGARNFVWIKYKAGMQSELADTVDCVVMGYYRGRGKRNKFGIGAFLVGVPDGKGQFVTVSKIGTGLTDKQWQETYRRCEKLKVSAKGRSSFGRKSQKKPAEYQVHKNLFPDVWCNPSLVVEIEADTITRSPIHTAGLALRFPRLKRFRDDKNPEQATSLKELKTLKSNQRG